MTQGNDGIHAGGLDCGIHAEKEADAGGDGESGQAVAAGPNREYARAPVMQVTALGAGQEKNST
jgi:hypothetical protein